MIQLCKLKRIMDDSGICSSFAGLLSQGIIEEVGDAVKMQISAIKDDGTHSFNIFSTFIEQTQNIINYFEQKKEQGNINFQMMDSVIIAVGKKNNNFFMTAGNLIDKKDGAIVTEKIENLRYKSKDELKKMYKEQIKKVREEGKRGAGLGFIDMARKSIKPIDFSIIDSIGEYDFFAYTVYLE